MARPLPVSVPLDRLILDTATWPQIIAGIPVNIPRQKILRRERTKLQTAAADVAETADGCPVSMWLAGPADGTRIKLLQCGQFIVAPDVSRSASMLDPHTGHSNFKLAISAFPYLLKTGHCASLQGVLRTVPNA